MQMIKTTIASRKNSKKNATIIYTGQNERLDIYVVKAISYPKGLATNERFIIHPTTIHFMKDVPDMTIHRWLTTAEKYKPVLHHLQKLVRDVQQQHR
jgi:hypothetical protein